jgi:hypothetical protein
MRNTNTNLMYEKKLMTKAMILSGIMMVSYILTISLVSENYAEATICFDCPGAKLHLDEAKKSIDAGDLEGAINHIDTARGLLENSTTLKNSTTK